MQHCTMHFRYHSKMASPEHRVTSGDSNTPQPGDGHESVQPSADETTPVNGDNNNDAADHAEPPGDETTPETETGDNNGTADHAEPSGNETTPETGNGDNNNDTAGHAEPSGDTTPETGDSDSSTPQPEDGNSNGVAGGGGELVPEDAWESLTQEQKDQWTDLFMSHGLDVKKWFPRFSETLKIVNPNSLSTGVIQFGGILISTAS